MLQGKHILIGISGGIAAYKIPELIRSLKKAGAEVKVTTTKNALEFVTELTLQTLSGARVYHDVFAAINEHSTEHISLPDWADIMLIAPATANVIGKMAQGIADDALTTTFVSTAARKPVVIAPAMNDKMYEAATTQAALTKLRAMPGITILEPAEGELACGSSGKGRMQEIDVLQEAIACSLTPKTLSNRHLLITAGPTQEKLDPVRYLSNYSTGKMGYALACEAARRGACVTLVCGPTTYRTALPDNVKIVSVRSAQEMCAAATEAWTKCDTAILSAAVADFRPDTEAAEKIKKQPGQQTLDLKLQLNPDIAATLGNSKRKDQILVGFALETEHEIDHALRKMHSKKMDMIVLNSLRDAGAGFGHDTNKVTILRADGTQKNLPLMSKQEVAAGILDALYSASD